MIGEILVARGVISAEQLEEAEARRRRVGGPIADNVAASGFAAAERIEAEIAQTPREPRTIEETGLSRGFLVKLLVKAAYVSGVQTTTEAAAATRLFFLIVSDVVAECVRLGLFESLSADGAALEGVGQIAERRFQLTDRGRAFAIASLAENGYVGPAPVPIDAYVEQVQRQPIAMERVGLGRLRAALAHFSLAPGLFDTVGPAVNSGRSLLLYGPAGNGKTGIAQALASVFAGAVFVPHAVEVDGQVIRVFDPIVHTPLPEEPAARTRASLGKIGLDRRWVPCRRPMVMTGGELTLDMLDLRYDAHSKFYECPVQMKAMGGLLVIDDFGRQAVRPADLLNRWIVPLDYRRDFLKLHTGKSFPVPFDSLLVFSTNLNPSELMDGAFLRRLPYKVLMPGPDAAQFRDALAGQMARHGLPTDDAAVGKVLDAIRSTGVEPAFYQTRFVCERIVDICRFNGLEPRVTDDGLARAVENLVVRH